MVIQLTKPKTSGKYLIWQPKEKEIVKKGYTGEKKNILDIKKQLEYFCGTKRTEDSIRKMAAKLGLTRFKRSNWTKAGVELLEALSGSFTPLQISLKMGRSLTAVYNKANALGIPLNQHHDLYTVNELASMLGVWDGTITRWLKQGTLKTAEHYTSDHWIITRCAVKEFIINHPTELTGRNIDVVQLVDILTS